MQKLALMMAVMILGMSPAHGCSIGANPGNQGVGEQAEMMLPLSTWSGGDGKTLMVRIELVQLRQKGAGLWGQKGTRSDESCSKSSWESKAWEG